MKKTLFLLLGLALSAQAAPVASKLLSGNIGQSIPLFGSQRNGEPTQSAVVNLDTSEIDTSKYFYTLVDKPILGALDTIGFVHFAYKDSAGSDSTRVKLIWYGNPRPDGQGIWTKIDSVNVVAGAITTYTAATPTPVVNSKRYAAIMFSIGNLSNSAVGLKSVAKDIVLNRAARIGAYQQ